MARGSWVRWMIAGAILALGTSSVLADGKTGQPSSARGGGGWRPSVNATGAVAGLTLDPRQMEIVQQVNAYFNDLTTLKGTFVQTGADGKRQRGKFYLMKPGRVRFEYAPPSKQLVISDGYQIAIKDLDIGTDDRVMLDQTPFRILLRRHVDLLRDAEILEVQEAEDMVIVSLRDRGRDASGKIRI
ncbi:MAG: LolA family protein, partial [Hyphomicrobiaceae bacterium]